MMAKLFYSALLLSSIALASEPSPDPLDLDWLRDEEKLLKHFSEDSADFVSNLPDQELRVRLTAELARGLKAMLRATLDRTQVDEVAIASGEPIDIESLLEEAYIEIRVDEEGNPIAVLLGKQATAFGQHASQIPRYRENLLHDVVRNDKVIGVTVRLEKELLAGLFDSVETSAFENGAGDLKIGDTSGYSVRLTKEIVAGLKATVSGLAAQNTAKAAWNDMEKRAALGLVYESGEGKWKAFAEGVVFGGRIEGPASGMGGTTGVAIDAGIGQVVLEFSILMKTAREVAIAYQVEIGKNAIVAPVLRQVEHEDGTREFRLGIQLEWELGRAAPRKRN